MSVTRVVQVLLEAVPQDVIERLVARWLEVGIVEWLDNTQTDLVWSDEQKQRGGTIRW